MRVLHIDTGRQMRGGQWQALYLIERLPGTLLCPAGSPLYERARAKGLEVRPLSAAAVWRERPDLMHAHDARAHTLAAVAGRAALIVSRRVAFPIGRGPLARWKYGRAAQFIAVSEYVRGQLVGAGVPADRIAVVYDGVPLPVEAGGGSEVVAPATGDPRKGSALAREAARLAGVELRFSADLAADTARAAVFLYLSDSEGLGSAALLAMGAGVPVIASRVGGLPEIVEDGVTGLVVENARAEIAAAIRRLLGDPALRRRLGAAGRQRVAGRFSVEAMVRGTQAVYDRLLP
jgi:hypothetical protein